MILHLTYLFKDKFHDTRNGISGYSYSTMEASECSRNPEKDNVTTEARVMPMFKTAIRRLETSVRVWGSRTESVLAVH